jgi:hypothetical protein
MGKLVKISPIKKSAANSTVQTMETGLLSKGMTRIPGTGVFKFPYKEISGKYRTGLDENAAYIQRIQDDVERKAEIDRILGWKKQLAEAFGITEDQLNPTSKFWNYTLYREGVDELHATPVKLLDQDNAFDLSIPRQLLAFAWLRVHPTIASSMQAYERGEYGPDVQWYVADDELDNSVLFKKKQVINKAIAELDSMTPTKMRKVARLMGLPISEDTKEEVVYNLLDTVIKDTEIKTGEHKGTNPIKLFNRFAHMQENILETSDLVEQAITHSVYRLQQGGKLYEGGMKIANSKSEWIEYLLNEDNQEDFIALRDKVKAKKLAAAS